MEVIELNFLVFKIKKKVTQVKKKKISKNEFHFYHLPTTKHSFLYILFLYNKTGEHRFSGFFNTSFYYVIEIYCNVCSL